MRSKIHASSNTCTCTQGVTSLTSVISAIQYLVDHVDERQGDTYVQLCSNFAMSAFDFAHQPALHSSCRQYYNPGTQNYVNRIGSPAIEDRSIKCIRRKLHSTLGNLYAAYAYRSIVDGVWDYNKPVSDRHQYFNHRVTQSQSIVGVFESCRWAFWFAFVGLRLLPYSKNKAQPGTRSLSWLCLQSWLLFIPCSLEIALGTFLQEQLTTTLYTTTRGGGVATDETRKV